MQWSAARHPGLVIRALGVVGAHVIAFLAVLGGMIALGARTLAVAHEIAKNPRLTLLEMREMGIRSLPLVAVISIFGGATTAWQADYQLSEYVPPRFIGGGVLRTILIELGPVLTALVVAGRVGASIAAELGTMRVTEQIDALAAMGINPVRYLVLPRIAAGLVVLPTLMIFADICGVGGGFVVATSLLDITPETFIYGMRSFFHGQDVSVGLFKSLLFGGVITLVGCYHGFNARGGAEGVGAAAIRAFVDASVAILICNYLAASLWF